MHIVFFSHPTFLGSQSMPRFTRMLAEGMKQRGHQVEIWLPQPKFYKLPLPKVLSKWLGYVDQYITFPAEVRGRLKHCSPETLFVFTDHALGPWVPLVASRPHVIHCHDFLAQLSALGKIAENPISWTGRQYQSFIRRGYSKGKYFISVSQKTREDLHRFLPLKPSISEVVYNGLNGVFTPYDQNEARAKLGKKIGISLSKGFILHVGGNEWYKNRSGVIEIYNAWRKSSQAVLPLLMIGSQPSPDLPKAYSQSPFKHDIHWLNGLNDELIRFAYNGAQVLLFPSLAEGFGWPIAEAMASGCPVITTDKAPMTEVAGDVGFLIPRRPYKHQDVDAWALKAAEVLNLVLLQAQEERMLIIKAGLKNAQRFQSELFINKIEEIYLNVLNLYE